MNHPEFTFFLDRMKLLFYDKAALFCCCKFCKLTRLNKQVNSQIKFATTILL